MREGPEADPVVLESVDGTTTVLHLEKLIFFSSGTRGDHLTPAIVISSSCPTISKATLSPVEG
jgi:hypothetical protein